MHNVCILIFAKQPLPGRVKTRMSPPLSAEESATVYQAMLLDVLDSCRHLSDVDLIIFYDDFPGAREYFLTLKDEKHLQAQEGSNLGERLANAFAVAFGRGYDRVVAIGTDSPDLPSRYLQKAVGHLADDRDSAVFGPTEDGGYYLVGLSAPHPSLFRDIPWSTGEVLEMSLQKCREAGLHPELLPRWYDLDTAADLARLSPDSSTEAAPRTCQAIAALREAGRI